MSGFRFGWLPLLAALCSQQISAQSLDPISSERPSFSSGPLVLAPGQWQIETGYSYTRDDDADFSLHTLPQALLRFGLSDEIELQFGWPGLSWREVGNNSDSGMNDATVVMKVQLTEDTAPTPVAFLAGVSLPIGDNEFSSDKVDPTIGAAWAHSRFFGTILITRSNDDYDFQNGVGVRFALKNEVSAYAEWQASLPENGGSAHQLNGGVLWLRRNNMQWDANLSLGLNDRAPDYSIGGGFSYRF